MKIPFTFLKLSFLSLSWYMGLCLICFTTVQGSCSCRINDHIDHIPPTPSLEFAKLFYDRDNNRLVVIIKNKGKETAKNLSLHYANISKDEKSRVTVCFNNTPTTTVLPIPDLAAGASTQAIYVSIDFQTAKQSLVQVAIRCEQQEVKIDTISVNRFPMDLLPIGDIILIVKPGEVGELKWKQVNDKHINFNNISLTVEKITGTNMHVSIEGTPISLNQSIDVVTITGADLEKLVKQKEILVKVKNHTTNFNRICCILLDNGKEIARIGNIVVSDIETALMPAAAVGDVKLVNQALAHNVDVNIKNTKHESLLHIAVIGGHQEIVKILLNNGADIHATDNEGNTALHVAACNGHQEIIRLLLQHSANKNIKNNKGETAADLAKDQKIKDLINNWKS